MNENQRSEVSGQRSVNQKLTHLQNENLVAFRARWVVLPLTFLHRAGAEELSVQARGAGKQIEALASSLQKVSAHVEMSKPVPKMAANDQ